jgi:dTDP-glucose pyrophosphorylase
LRGEYGLTEAIRELATSGKRVEALELTREWVDVRDSEVLVSPNQTP